VAPDLEQYRAGHAEGVRVYCRASNGFAVGHGGAAYQGVCPADLEAEFVAEYNAGRRLHELESALANVDARIAGHYRTQENIKKELADMVVEMAASETTAERRVALVTRSAELGKRHGELSTEIRELERVRVVAERELLDYRQTIAATF
jgi:predicted  nucleic acid-binding Zn-ribbon protein